MSVPDNWMPNVLFHLMKFSSFSMKILVLNELIMSFLVKYTCLHLSDLTEAGFISEWGPPNQLQCVSLDVH